MARMACDVEMPKSAQYSVQHVNKPIGGEDQKEKVHAGLLGRPYKGKTRLLTDIRYLLCISIR